MIFALMGCALLGFAAGLFSFKRTDRWCPECGNTTVCLRHEHERQRRVAR